MSNDVKSVNFYQLFLFLVLCEKEKKRNDKIWSDLMLGYLFIHFFCLFCLSGSFFDFSPHGSWGSCVLVHSSLSICTFVWIITGFFEKFITRYSCIHVFSSHKENAESSGDTSYVPKTYGPFYLVRKKLWIIKVGCCWVVFEILT